MTTTTESTVTDNPVAQASSPMAYRAAWFSIALTTIGLVLICLGDPYWLSLPASILGILTGGYALRHGQDNHACAHIGFNVGMFNLLLWLLLMGLMQHVLKMDVSSLFAVPRH
ncbi:MAG: hypothetical protein CMJ19_23450 [Phycisphaeraceae bacterium]|nr:hypothetical protein [Phycisphaeraceae bacterium]